MTEVHMNFDKLIPGHAYNNSNDSFHWKNKYLFNNAVNLKTSVLEFDKFDSIGTKANHL